MKAALRSRARLVKRIRSIRPTHVAVAGKTRPAFAAYILWDVAAPGTRVLRIYHPSCHGKTDRNYYDHVKDRLKEAIRR